MKNSYIKDLITSIVVLTLLYGHETNAQTLIKPGEVSGIWTRQGAPYQIAGDINIPWGKTLIIQPGVKISFKGPYVINVQGSLRAVGTKKDSIVFTIEDTLGYYNNYNIGWNGIHFDPRPIRWDTVSCDVSEGEEKGTETTRLQKQTGYGSSEKILLSLQGPDLVNDETFKTLPTKAKQGSHLAYCRFEFGTMGQRQRPYIFGGAIYIYRYSSLIISNSVFKHNRSYAGGAVYCKEAAPILANNTFSNCEAMSSGGAMVFIHSGPILAENSISHNSSGHNGGAILFYESCPYMLNNILLNNKAANFGGALFIERKTGQIISTGDYKINENTKVSQDLSAMKLNLNNDIIKNTGGSNGRFFNNLICGNSAKNGGGTGLYATAPDFTNNTICNNQAEESGGGFYNFYSSPSIVNTIIYGNRSENVEGQQMYMVGRNSLTISYSNVEEGISGIGQDSTCKLSLDYFSIQNTPPLFADPGKYDYSLQKGSPCINAGNTDTASLRITAYDVNKANRINNRFIDLGAIEHIESDENKLKSTNEQDEFANESESIGANETLFNIYPNPSNGRFSIIIYNNPYQRIRISVLTHLGTSVYDKVIAVGNTVLEVVDMEKNLPGIYIVQIYDDNGIIYKDKVIID